MVVFKIAKVAMVGRVLGVIKGFVNCHKQPLKGYKGRVPIQQAVQTHEFLLEWHQSSKGGTLGVVRLLTSPEIIRPDYKMLTSGPAPFCPGAIELGPSLVLDCTEFIALVRSSNVT
nr:hypothetical protein [Tanacetum cinerariifolium]